MKCSNGFYLANQVCRQNPPNCDNFTINVGCTSCVAGFTVRGGQCVSNNVNMNGCKSLTSAVECRECLAGYSLNPDRICLDVMCLRFDTTFSCIECPPRF